MGKQTQCTKAKKTTNAARIEANKERRIHRDALLKIKAERKIMVKHVVHGKARADRREQARNAPQTHLDPERFNPALVLKDLQGLIRRAA